VVEAPERRLLNHDLSFECFRAARSLREGDEDEDEEIWSGIRDV
jgi:hypothetical protein